MSLEQKEYPPIGGDAPSAWAPSDHRTPQPKPSKASDEEEQLHIADGNHDHNIPIPTANDNLQDHHHQLEISQSHAQGFHSLAREALVVAVLCSSLFLTQSGLALSIMTQHSIALSFGIEKNQQQGTLSWFSAGYSLTVGTFILVAGRLGDVFGHKRFFVGGFAWFGLWSAVAGFSVYCSSGGGPSFFVFCRAMQGIGPAFLLPNAIAILSRCYEPGSRHQNMVFSLFGATAPGGFVVGAVFASLIAQMAWWPWAYWVMCFACLVFALLGVFVIPATQPPPSKLEHDEKSSIWQRIDITGSVTGVTALVLFAFAWNQGPVVGWPTPYVYIIMIVGIIVFVAFVLVERRASYPLIPIGILGTDSFFTLACVSAGWSSFGILVIYIWNILTVLRGQNPLLTSVQLTPVAISGLCAAVTTGLVLHLFGERIVMLISMTAFLTGGIILATVPVHQTYWAQTFVGIVLLPWGMDMSFPAATIVLSRAMPRRHQGLAASLVNTFVNYSISIGLGLAGTVDSQVNDGGKDALRGYRGAFYMAIGLSSLGVMIALIACFVGRHRSKESENMAQESSRA